MGENLGIAAFLLGHGQRTVLAHPHAVSVPAPAKNPLGRLASRLTAMTSDGPKSTLEPAQEPSIARPPFGLVPTEESLVFHIDGPTTAPPSDHVDGMHRANGGMFVDATRHRVCVSTRRPAKRTFPFGELTAPRLGRGLQVTMHRGIGFDSPNVRPVRHPCERAIGRSAPYSIVGFGPAAA